MPKLKQTEAQKDRERMRRNLRVIQSMNGLTSEDAGKIIGKSRSTWDNRLKNPDSLTLEEVRTLCTKFGIDRARFCFGEIFQK